MAETRATVARAEWFVGRSHRRTTSTVVEALVAPESGLGRRAIRAVRRPWLISCWSAIHGGPMQFEEIVTQADQRPFLLDPHESPPQELAKAAGVFDLSEHRFHDRLASRVDGVPPPRRELARHPVLGREPLGRAPARGDRRGLTVLPASGGDERLDPLRFQRLHVAFGPVTRVRQHALRLAP